MEIGIRVKIEREKKGWSQTELAKRAGLSQIAISQLESGKRHPMAETIIKVAKAIGKSVESLYDESDAPSIRVPTNVIEFVAPIPPHLEQEYREVEAQFNENAAKDPEFVARVLRIIHSGLLDTESGVEALETLARALRPEPGKKKQDDSQQES